MPEIRQKVREDPALQNLTTEEEDELRADVLDHREEKKLGACPTNRAAAQDYRRQLLSLNQQIAALSIRTGAAVVCFFSRSRLDDTFQPNWIATDNATTFFQDALGRNMWDVIRLFEQWACTKSQICSPDCLSSMCQECSNSINGSLKMVTWTPTATMNYLNYDMNVGQKYKVQLVGWTFRKFVSPYNIHTVDDLRTLRDALRCGTCFWMALSKTEVTKHAKGIAEREAAGEVVLKKRKQRSDKGVKKGPKKKPGAGEGEEDDNTEDEGVEEEGPSKRQKISATGKAKDTAAAKKAKGKENAPAKSAKVKGKRPAQSAKSQIPPSREILTDTDTEDDDY